MNATESIQKQSTEQRRIVSVKEFLKLVPIGRESAYRAFKDGKLPCLKFGKKVLVDVDEVLAAMRMNGSTGK